MKGFLEWTATTKCRIFKLVQDFVLMIRDSLFFLWSLIVLICFMSSNSFGGSYLFPSQNISQDVKDKITNSTSNIENLLRKSAGSKETIQQNLISPMLGSGNMTTLDRSKSFSTSIACPSSKEFLTITVQSNETGDLYVQAFWDTNFDGEMDRSTSFSGISGVCTNGFIFCSSGTWNNCTYYTVVYNNGDFTLQEVSLNSLSGCFCVNRSCTASSSFINNLNYYLQTIGGVFVSAMRNVNPRYAISQVKIDGPSIKYYGQNVGSCKAPQGGTGAYSVERYYDTPSLLLPDAQSAFSYEKLHPQSGVTVKELLTSHYKRTSEATCTIKRVVEAKTYDLTEVVGSVEAQYCPSINPGPFVCGLQCLEYVVPIYISAGNEYRATLTINITPEFKEKLIDSAFIWCTYTRGPYPCTDDDARDNGVRIYLNGQLVYHVTYKDSEDCGDAPYGGCWHKAPIDPSLYKEGPNTIIVSIEGAGGGEGVESGCRELRLKMLFNAPLQGCYISENRTEDTCTTLSSRSDCKLKREKQDDVLVYDNYQLTGLKNIPSCRTFCDQVVCYDWWTQERTYECETPTTDLSFAEKRLAAISSSATYSGSELTFTDIRYDNKTGTWKEYPDQKIYISGQQGEDCELMCEVRKKKDASQLGQLGPLNITLRRDQQQYAYYYRSCTDEVCPYNPNEGEEIVQDCTCVDNFHDAVLAIQALRLAGQDIICSTGNEVALGR
ncbi:MAG: hypothetical protein ACP5HC_02280 [Caldisericum sp.]